MTLRKMENSLCFSRKSWKILSDDALHVNFALWSSKKKEIQYKARVKSALNLNSVEILSLQMLKRIFPTNQRIFLCSLSRARSCTILTPFGREGIFHQNLIIQLETNGNCNCGERKRKKNMRKTRHCSKFRFPWK